MRKLTAIIAALGFLGSTSLTPVLAAPSFDNASVDMSAQKKPKKVERTKVKTVKPKSASLIGHDVSAQKVKKLRKSAKKPRAKVKAKTAEVQTVGDLSAQKVKKPRKTAKKPRVKAKAKTAAIYYRIAA
jgi:hypothetical protein